MGSFAKIGACGGVGGAAKDMDMTGVNRVVMIVVNHGFTVDSITIVYERNGLEESTDLWGGGGGSRSEVRLGREEYLTSVKGHVGPYNGLTLVRSLAFNSNLRTFGPYGVEEGVPFELPAVCPGGKILGFHARAGSLLDAIGTYVKPS